MTSIRTQAHGVLAFDLTPTRLGISLSLSKVWQAQKSCYKRKRPRDMICQQQRMTSRTQAHRVLTFKLTRTRIEISLSLSLKYGQPQNLCYKRKRPSVMICQRQRMTSIRTQAHGVLALKLTRTRLGISLSLSNVWRAQNRSYKRKRRHVMIRQQQRMTSIRTQAKGVLTFKLTRTLIGISLSLSKVWQAPK